MRARYSTVDVELVVEMKTSDDKREIGVRILRGTVVPAPFVEALTASCDIVRAKSVADPPTAFAALIEAMKERNVELVLMPDADFRLEMRVDLATGATESTTVQVPGGEPADPGLADSVAHIVRQTMRKLLASDPEKLRDALNRDDPNAFVESLSHLPITDRSTRDSVLTCVEEALGRTSWVAQHAVIAGRAAHLSVHSGDPRRARALLRTLLSIPSIDADLRFGAHLGLGNSYATEGRYEAAADVYRSLLDGDISAVGTQNVAWAHHNLGAVLLNLGREDEGLQRFRQAGAIRATEAPCDEPAMTLGAAASILERRHLRAAVVLYDEIAASLEDSTEPRCRRLRGHALYLAARVACNDLGQFDAALRRLRLARPLLEVLHEDADTVAGAMLLESVCLDGCGDHEAATRVRAERAAFLKVRPHLESTHLERLVSSGEEIDDNVSEKLKSRVMLLKGIDALSGLEGLELTDKVETLLDELATPEERDRHALMGILLEYVGHQAERAGRRDRALTFYLRAQAEHPASLKHRTRVATCLYHLGRLAEAAQAGLSLARDNPDSYVGFLIAGMAAYKAADYDLAEQMLREVVARDADHPTAKEFLAKVSQERLGRVLRGAAVESRLLQGVAPTTHNSFLAYLEAFATRARLNSDALWKSRSDGRLVQNPENASRGLLAQDLAATTRAVALYKESIVAGGRIDLIANVLGAEFIVELKICGAGYSKTYAEGGFSQLKQYLRERNATRGYLLVFDARVAQEGTDAMPRELDLGDGMVAFCVSINIRGVEQ